MERKLASPLVPIACAAAVAAAITGCASGGAQHEKTAVQANLVQIVKPARVVTPVVTQAAPSPVTVVTTAPSPSAVTSTPAAPGASAVAPHFDTPEAAMRYLVAAYNANNETNIRHVTTPGSRDQFEPERQWVKEFRFRSCTANGAPSWDYTCVLDIVSTMPGVQAATDPTGNQIMDEVTVLVAPAERPGYYLEANEGCGGG